MLRWYSTCPFKLYYSLTYDAMNNISYWTNYDLFPILGGNELIREDSVYLISHLHISF